MAEHESSIAVLVDFENMARPGAKGRGDFDINLVLDRLAEKGRVLVKRSYADWSRYRDARHELMNSGMELIEMPSAREGAKNRADIKMAVDAMELAYSREHLDTFVIVSGDSDFTPLVGKLRELNKRVIGMGNRDSASDLLIANSDEFIFYDSLTGGRGGTPPATGRRLDPLELLSQTLMALQREGTEWPLASVVKDSMRRKNPAFDENETGYSTFSKFLENAQSKGIVGLQTDPRSGTYRVEMAGSSPAGSAPAAPSEAASAPAESSRTNGDDDRDATRRRRRRRRSESSEPKAEVFEIVIDSVADAAIADIPLDQPISYEDVILAGPDPTADTPPLLEATDLPADSDAGDDDAPSTRRRRRRRGSSAAETSDADAAPGSADATDEATDAPAEASDAIATDEADEAAPGRARRRRRRTTPAAADATPVEPDASGAPVPSDATADEQPVAEADAPAADEAEAPPVEEAEAPSADEAPAATTRRRSRVPRRRGTATDDDGATADATETEAEAPVAEALAAEAPAEEAAPKPAARRTRRTKAQIEADKAADAGDGDAPAAPADEPKPKTARRTRRTKAQIEADKAADAASTTGDGDAPAAPADEAKPKTARRTRRTKAQIEADKAADAASTTGDGDAPAAPADEAKPKTARRTRRTKAQIEADKAAAADVPAAE